MESQQGLVMAGARLAWRRQSVLWWVYAVNLVLALMGTLPMAMRARAVLDNSLAAERLVNGFDLTTFADLIAQPSAPLRTPAPFFFAVIFFIFVLFAEGGILEVYRLDRSLTTADFFQASGSFFWRFIRLLVFFLIVLVPINILARLVVRGSDKLASDAPQPMLGFWVEVAGLILVLFLLMAVRLWFDMAQLLTVDENQRAARWALAKTFKLTVGNFGSLFWIYLRISLLAWAGVAMAFYTWVRLVRPEWIGVSFLLTQAVLLLWLGTRLWQRASETLWYQRHLAATASAP